MKKKFVPNSITASEQTQYEGTYKGYTWEIIGGELHIFSESGSEYVVCEIVSGPFDTRRATSDILCILEVDGLDGYKLPLEDNMLCLAGASTASIEDVIDWIEYENRG
jgi:hypothetical protein